MESNDRTVPSGVPFAAFPAHRAERAEALDGGDATFHDRFVEVFDEHYPRLFRYMNRLSGESELAADVVQEAFVRLYRRGSFPARPGAWLVSVAMNLFRNERSTRSRRLKLLSPARAEETLSDPPVAPDRAVVVGEARRRVRAALEKLPERDRRLLLMQAEGYRYAEIASALRLNEASVGVFLARARRAFRAAFEEDERAS